MRGAERTLALGLTLLVLAVGGGCVQTYAGRLKTRDPLEEGRLDRYRSGTIVLGIGDVDVKDARGGQVLLTQSAWFEVVSENEMRFFVLVSHKHESLARLENYRITLRTNTGLEIAPSRITPRRSLVERHDTTLAQVRQGVYAHSPPTYSEETITRDLHGGEGVIVFQHEGLVSRAVRSYTLCLESPKRRLRFTWDLVPKAELGDEE